MKLLLLEVGLEIWCCCECCKMKLGLFCLECLLILVGIVVVGLMLFVRLLFLFFLVMFMCRVGLICCCR